MNILKRVAAVILIVMLIAAFAGCSKTVSGDAADAVGEYKTAGVTAEEFGSYIIDPESLGYESTITLRDDGKGYMTINDEGGDIESWKVSGKNITIKSGVSTITGTYENGILKLSFDEYLIYYARDGADTSSIKTIGVDEFSDIISGVEE